jgi:predicted DNA-binding transcriptional regulator AlpA
MTMTTFDFTVIASGLDPQADDFEARFYEAGCDDATVSFQNGHILLDFSREADSISRAIASAVADATAAGAVVERVEPDPLVSLSDMAARSGMTRSAMTNYYKGHRQEGFPAPKARVTTSSPLWDWADVAEWLYRHGRILRAEAIGAGVVSAANELIEADLGALPVALGEREKRLEAGLA